MISKSVYVDDVRVRREAESLIDMGHTVTVISTDDGRFDSAGVKVIGAGTSAGLTSLRPAKRSAVYRAMRWGLLPEHRAGAIRQFQSKAVEAATTAGVTVDVVHAHDFPALRPATELADMWGSKLIYDAHEYWGGLPRYGRPEPLRKRNARKLERSLARNADHVITVSEGAAELLSKDLGISEITVVKNSFPVNHDLEPPEDPVGAVYAGRVGAGRDLETVFAAGIWEEDFQLHLMGPTDNTVRPPPYANVCPTGSMGDVDRLLNRVGISLITLTKGPINHDIALPNKLFQALSAGIPVVASDLPEMAALISNYRIGSLYRSGDPSSLTKAITQLRNDYETFRKNVVNSQAQLSWPADMARLRSVYTALSSP